MGGLVWTGTASCLRPSSPAPTTAEDDQGSESPPRTRPATRGSNSLSAPSIARPIRKSRPTARRRPRGQPWAPPTPGPPSATAPPRARACGKRCRRSVIRRTTTGSRRGQGEQHALVGGENPSKGEACPIDDSAASEAEARCRTPTTNTCTSGPSDGNDDGNAAEPQGTSGGT
jgi:hypothetical protein